MKKLFPVFLAFFLSGGGFAQNLPTLVSFEMDTLCAGDFGEVLVFNIVVEDLDADSTYIVPVSWNAGVLMGVDAVNPPFVPGNTLRTFQLLGDVGTGAGPGLNLTDIGIEIHGSGTDGGFTSETLPDAPVYGDLGATLNLSSLSLCSNGNPVDIRPYASPAGGNFSWTTEESYMFDPEVYYNLGGGSVSYYYTNAAGCMDYVSAPGPNILTPPVLSVSPSSSTCGNADASITSSVSGGQAPYHIYWSTGFSEMISGGIPATLNNLAAGNYYGNITDANGCKAVALAQVSDIEVALTGNISDESCMYSSQNGAIDLTVSTAGTVNYIYWSNGQQTEDITNLHKGEYTVEVRTDAGCEANGLFFVSAIPSAYEQNVNSTDASCSASNGIIDYDIYGGSGSYSYLWNTGATTQDLFGVPAGTYTCVVTDLATSCSFSYWHQVFSITGPGAYLNNMTPATCGVADGRIDMEVYSFSSPLASISWNTGQTTEDLVNVTAGDYEITVTALDGCIFKQTVTLENKLPEQPQICMLTVDTSLIYNMVVWEKSGMTGIDGFNVYRETSVYGVFEKVADRPYSLESFFQDNDASPMDRSWRYYITAYDACGNESYGSDVHKTIHVVSTTPDNINYTVSWDNYEGLNYTSVDVFRFDDTNGWTTIANLPFGTNTTTDVPPVTSGLDYMISFNLSDPCTSTKAQDHNSSRSNKTASVFDAGGSTAQANELSNGTVFLYPNPADDQFVIRVSEPDAFQVFEILDINGKLILTGAIDSTYTVITTENMAPGVYLIRLVSNRETVLQRLVRN